MRRRKILNMSHPNVVQLIIVAFPSISSKHPWGMTLRDVFILNNYPDSIEAKRDITGTKSF
jgi:hypothetical protein